MIARDEQAPMIEGQHCTPKHNLLNHIDESKEASWSSQYVKDAFKKHVNRYERLAPTPAQTRRRSTS
jgi:hypothetical protein